MKRRRGKSRAFRRMVLARDGCVCNAGCLLDWVVNYGFPAGRRLKFNRFYAVAVMGMAGLKRAGKKNVYDGSNRGIWTC